MQETYFEIGFVVQDLTPLEHQDKIISQIKTLRKIMN